jgi:hypothetical protein
MKSNTLPTEIYHPTKKGNENHLDFETNSICSYMDPYGVLYTVYVSKYTPNIIL